MTGNNSSSSSWMMLQSVKVWFEASGESSSFSTCFLKIEKACHISTATSWMLSDLGSLYQFGKYVVVKIDAFRRVTLCDLLQSFFLERLILCYYRPCNIVFIKAVPSLRNVCYKAVPVVFNVWLQSCRCLQLWSDNVNKVAWVKAGEPCLSVRNC